MPLPDTNTEHIATPSFWISRKRKRGRPETTSQPSFPLLFDNEEPPPARDLRQTTFHTLWTQQQQAISDILGTFNEKITTELSEFVAAEQTRETIHSAVILAGSNIAGHTRLFVQVRERLGNVMQGPVIVLSASEITNLQSLLKKIVSGCVQIDLEDDEDEPIKNVKMPGRLPYDLDIIEEWAATQKAKNFRIVIAFQDTESFPINVISEFIIRNQDRLKRLPVILLFGVASTLDQFQLMLPSSVIKILDTRIFEVRQDDECLKIIIDRILMEDGIRLRLGPRVLKFLMDRYNNWNQSVEDFISGIKYAYMCHFYANPLSIILAIQGIDADHLPNYLTATHLTAIRSLPSMRRYVEEKLSEGDTEEVKSILFDDSYLTHLLLPLMDQLMSKAQELREAVIVLTKLSERGKARQSMGGVYLGVLKGEITVQSPSVRELLQLQRVDSRKFSSTSLIEFLSTTIDALPPSSTTLIDLLSQYLEEIQLLTQEAQSQETLQKQAPKMNLISEFDIESRPGMRSTKVSAKLRHHLDRENMTSKDEEYTKLTESVNEVLKEVFENLVPQSGFPLSEIFYFNILKTHTDVFSPQPRESLKTAFRNPAHWLSCSCCVKSSPDDAIFPTQPSTSILHELYTDTTTGLINLYDWFGVYAEVRKKSGLSEEELLASFMESLDELVWMGYVKRTMKKTDHVEKLVGG